MEPSEVRVPNSVTITDVLYSIDRLGTIIPTIVIDPPIRYSLSIGDHSKVFSMQYIPLPVSDIAGYDQIGVGSKVYLKRTNMFADAAAEAVQDSKHPVIPNIANSYVALQLAEDSPELAETAKRIVIHDCPACGHTLRNYAGTYFCANQGCPSQILKRCTHFLNSIGVYLHGMFYQAFCILIARGAIHTPLDIFYTDNDQIQAALPDGYDGDKYVATYWELIHKVMGTVSMTQFLLGLDVFSSRNTNTDLLVRKFVTYMNDQIRINKGTVFDIDMLLSVVDDAAMTLGIYIGEDHVDHMPMIHNQILKLSDTNRSYLKRIFGPLNDYQIALLLAYCSRPDNRFMLQGFSALGLIGTV